MNPDRLHYLMLQYIGNTCTKEELNELLACIRENKKEQELMRELRQYWDTSTTDTQDNDKWDNRFFAMMKESSGETGPLDQSDQPRKRRLFRAMAATMFLLILMAGAYYLFNGNNPHKPQVSVANNTLDKYKNDVAPGGNRATLTLANGSTISLDSVHNGSLAHQGNSKILKMNNGRLIYHAAGGSDKSAVVYNTISTPRGGQYELILADGSKVWLNAASSLKFPASFAGKNREVELTGEAYFEIAANKDKPFIVKTGQAKIQVLGTHFNVMAYNAEIKTTLLEGSVKMNYKSATATLKPGQQARVNTNQENIKVANVDVEEAVAWKNGLFQFNNTSLETIMQQISRWYDVEVLYADPAPSRRFTGKMSRNVSLQHVLKVLELSDVKFTLEGKKIKVFQ